MSKKHFGRKGKDSCPVSRGGGSQSRCWRGCRTTPASCPILNSFNIWEKPKEAKKQRLKICQLKRRMPIKSAKLVNNSGKSFRDGLAWNKKGRSNESLFIPAFQGLDAALILEVIWNPSMAVKFEQKQGLMQIEMYLEVSRGPLSKF